eukprot:3548199-Rhodomonas_salina.1
MRGECSVWRKHGQSNAAVVPDCDAAVSSSVLSTQVGDAGQGGDCHHGISGSRTDDCIQRQHREHVEPGVGRDVCAAVDRLCHGIARGLPQAAPGSSSLFRTSCTGSLVQNNVRPAAAA